MSYSFELILRIGAHSCLIFKIWFIKCGELAYYSANPTTIVTYEKLKHTAAIYSKSTIFSSSLSDMCTLVFVAYEMGASYDKPRQFHKKQGWSLILATHTFLTKYDWYSHICACQQVPLTFLGKCFSHLWDYFSCQFYSKMSYYHILKFLECVWLLVRYHFVIHSLS